MSVTKSLLDRVLEKAPPALRWRRVPAPFPGQELYLRVPDHLQVIVSAGTHPDDSRTWLHISCAFPTRLPSWEDLKEVKSAFVGDARTALQVFPPKKDWVNIHDFCLHLWCCLDADVVPNFAENGSI